MLDVVARLNTTKPMDDMDLALLVSIILRTYVAVSFVPTFADY